MDVMVCGGLGLGKDIGGTLAAVMDDLCDSIRAVVILCILLVSPYQSSVMDPASTEVSVEALRDGVGIVCRGAEGAVCVFDFHGLRFSVDFIAEPS